MIHFRPDCKNIAYLYTNDRTHFDKPACLKGYGSYPHDWSCEKYCPCFELNRLYKEVDIDE
jgi:hypothetical protein